MPGLGWAGSCAFTGPGTNRPRPVIYHELQGASSGSPPTYPPCPGMARKRAQREARATEEAIAAGMLSVRSLAKKRRRESSAARPRDQGLQEDGGSFRAGVMRVSRPPPPSAKRGGRR